MMIPGSDKVDELIAHMAPGALAALENISVTRTFAKGSFLLRQDETARKSYHILDGIARRYYLDGDREITTAFFFADDLALAFDSYILQRPGREFVQCITEVTASVTDYQAFEAAKQKYPDLLRFDLLLTELYAVWLEERLFEFHTCNAEQRYRTLLDKDPHIVLQVPLKYIASYLGISLETLSRIRARI
ncbi:Crp/Fnr family transcriptional regulator [Taibaiella chishuiensis]|uniref:CRP-like cAMP-binding protein n=1 Tax=Taibaiella chishuiensis TaxID=1434707 RepID=A0A2P8D390_9BACT|nr:Crp/Fnr family transcriptional regulator [Taibaiella chishuiensis]PSK91694.1 CRP-like cAMP-binding protein [Taibaiella chishuiensis]